MLNTESNKCVSCGNTFTNKYCNACGEKRIKKENQKITHFLGQIINEIAFWDTKFIRTLKLLLFKPGFLAKEFIDGRRNIYTKPVALFFIANLIYFFVQPVDILNSSFYLQLNQHNYSEYITEIVQEKIIDNDTSYELLEEAYNKKSPDNSRIFALIMVFLFTIPLSLLYFSRKRYYVEHLIFSFNFFSIIIYLLFLVAPILLYFVQYTLYHIFEYKEELVNINGVRVLLFIFLILLTYLAIGLKTFYQQKYWLSIIKAILLSISTMLIVYYYKFILFLITLAMI